MASSLSLHLAVALLLMVVHHHAASDDPAVFDLDEKVESFVENMAKKHKQIVSWWDMRGEHKHLKEFAHKYKKYKVTVTAKNLKYGAVKSSTERPSVVYTQWAHNGQPSSAQQVTVKRTTKREKIATWHTELAFHSSLTVNATAGIPNVAKFDSRFQANLDLRMGRGQQHSETEVFSVNQVINVPPMTSVKIEWIITDFVQEIPWTATVNARGWIAVWYDQKVDNHWLWFYPITFLRDPLLKYAGENTVEFTAKGVFTAVNAHEGHLRVSEFDLEQYSGRSSTLKTYTIPLGSTQ